jgi:hypothetical protein
MLGFIVSIGSLMILAVMFYFSLVAGPEEFKGSNKK